MTTTPTSPPGFRDGIEAAARELDWAARQARENTVAFAGADYAAAFAERIEARAAFLRSTPDTLPTGWNSDMGEAPRDGTPFWGSVGDDAIRMFWHPQFKAFVSSFSRMTMAPGYTIDGQTTRDHHPVVHKPIAWMHLPLPPPPPGE